MPGTVTESPVTLQEYGSMTMQEREALWLEISDITEEEFKAHMMREKDREVDVPGVGAYAPDFTADVLGNNRKRTGEKVVLSQLRGKPVGIAFGSFTWPPFRGKAVRLNELYSKYGDRVQFYIIYIREAHPAAGWQVPNNLIENVIYDEPSTDAERTDVASACQINLGLKMPMLIDSIDNDIDKKYVGLPMRQFLIDSEGKIAYAGEKGPFGWDDQAFEEELQKLVEWTRDSKI